MAQVSIIVRTFNRYLFLERAFLDITNQSYNDWEIILVNDGGDKEKVELLLSRLLSSEQYTLIHNNGNKGLHKAVNIGVKAASGKYVVIHDDDDTWDSGFLSETICYLDNNPGCYGVITHSNIVYERVLDNCIKTKRIKPYNSQLKGIVSIYDMLKNNQYPPISFIYRREVFDTIGCFDESLKVLEDWEFNLRFLSKFDIHILEMPLANYHIRIKDYALQDSYRNTITSQKSIHEKYDIIIRNRYLRSDLVKKEIGLGVLMNILRWSDGKILGIIKRILRNTVQKKKYQLTGSGMVDRSDKATY